MLPTVPKQPDLRANLPLPNKQPDLLHTVLHLSFSCDWLINQECGGFKDTKGQLDWTHQASGSRMVYSCGDVVSGKLSRTASRCGRSSAPWYVNKMSSACTLLSWKKSRQSKPEQRSCLDGLSDKRKVPVQHCAIKFLRLGG